MTDIDDPPLFGTPIKLESRYPNVSSSLIPEDWVWTCPVDGTVIRGIIFKVVREEIEQHSIIHDVNRLRRATEAVAPSTKPKAEPQQHAKSVEEKEIEAWIAAQKGSK